MTIRHDRTLLSGIQACAMLDSRYKHAGMTAGAPHSLTIESTCHDGSASGPLSACPISTPFGDAYHEQPHECQARKQRAKFHAERVEDKTHRI